MDLGSISLESIVDDFYPSASFEKDVNFELRSTEYLLRAFESYAEASIIIEGVNFAEKIVRMNGFESFDILSMEGIGTKILEGFKKALKAIIEFFKNMWQAIVDFVKHISNYIQSLGLKKRIEWYNKNRSKVEEALSGDKWKDLKVNLPGVPKIKDVEFIEFSKEKNVNFNRAVDGEGLKFYLLGDLAERLSDHWNLFISLSERDARDLSDIISQLEDAKTNIDSQLNGFKTKDGDVVNIHSLVREFMYESNDKKDKNEVLLSEMSIGIFDAFLSSEMLDNINKQIKFGKKESKTLKTYSNAMSNGLKVFDFLNKRTKNFDVDQASTVSRMMIEINKTFTSIIRITHSMNTEGTKQIIKVMKALSGAAKTVVGSEAEK